MNTDDTNNFANEIVDKIEDNEKDASAFTSKILDKKLSVSSTESLNSNSDILFSSNTIAGLNTVKNEASSGVNLNPNLNATGEEADLEKYDYDKAGAKPKVKPASNLVNSKSSVPSTSTSCSSLSSLISQSSSNNTKSTTSSRRKSKSNSYKMSHAPATNEFQYPLGTGKCCTDEPIKCPLCFQMVDGDLESHFQKDHQEYECPFCGLLFDTDTVLNQHVNSIHNDDLAPKSTSYSTVYQTPMSTNLPEGDNEQRFTCPVCQLKLKDELWLEIHVDSHFNPASPVNQDNSNFYSINVNQSNSDKSSQKMSSNLNDDFATSREDAMGAVAAFATTSAKSSIDLFGLKKPRSRNDSASSVTANVGENFEIDQIITLSECNMMMDLDENKNPNGKKSQNERPHVSSMYNLRNEHEFIDDDYQLALLLDNQEKEKFRKVKSDNFNMTKKNIDDFNQINSDFLKAQLMERSQNESVKYQLSKENIKDEDYAINLSADYQSDAEYAAELEHEWLKQRFGMNNSTASSKALFNLERAFKSNRLDHVTYEYEKGQIENKINSIYDDSKTCSKDIIEILKSIPLNKTTHLRLLCSNCNHYASGFIDSGYGCGYRNTQMLLSSIREDPSLSGVIFNNDNKNMPSITKIQQLIENAWKNGFDLMGKAQLGGVLEKTAKWIGASDVAAMFLSLKIRVELVDVKPSPTSEKNIGSILFDYVKNHFEQEAKSGRHVHPIYLQHDGHSRTIIGVETAAKSSSLLIFDPSTRKNTIEQNRTNKPKLLNLFRKNINSFNNKKEYQLLIIRGAITSNDEYQRSKVLQSTKIF